MGVSEMELKQKAEETVDAFAQWLYKLSYWLVILTCFGFLALFFLFLFGGYIGFVYKDQDIVEWCEEYHPNWTYEQCENMVGR
jgi:hypothetical protein